MTSGESANINLDLWDLFTAIISLGLTNQISKMSLVSSVLKTNKHTLEKIL